MSLHTDIIIPTYNQSGYTIDCLYSIKQCTDNYRIIWVDNGSEHKHRKAVIDYIVEENIHAVPLYNETNEGFIKAVNRGLRLSLTSGRRRYICIQNNDTIVEPEWLDKMIEVLEQNDKAGLVGPTTIYAESWQNRDNLKKHWGPPSTWPTMKKVNGMLAFFCTLFKPEVFEKIGLLDEQYGLGFGDDDAFCEDAKDAGYDLYVRTDVTVPHYHRTTFKKYVPDWRERQQENIAKFKRNYGIR